VNGLGDLTRAFRGWVQLLTGKPEAVRFFRLDYFGFVVAIGWYTAAVLLVVAVQSSAIGLPSVSSFLFGLFAQAVTIGVLGLAITQSLKFLKADVPPNRLLIPVLYALCFMFVVSIPLTLVSPGAGLIAVLAAGYPIYRAARQLAALPVRLAGALTLLCVIVLVVVPNALYIVFLQIPSPA